MHVNTRVLVVQIGLLFLAFAVSLFLPAGTIAWPAGWVYLVLFFGFVAAITTWLFRYNPGLLTERMTGLGKSDQKGWDWGSWYGVLGALVLVFMMGIRAVLEEQALRKELLGYDVYMGQMKYRLIPHVW